LFNAGPSRRSPVKADNLPLHAKRPTLRAVVKTGDEYEMSTFNPGHGRPNGLQISRAPFFSLICPNLLDAFCSLSRDGGSSGKVKPKGFASHPNAVINANNVTNVALSRLFEYFVQPYKYLGIVSVSAGDFWLLRRVRQKVFKAHGF
jgi:hypothetical protein